MPIQTHLAAIRSLKLGLRKRTGLP